MTTRPAVSHALACCRDVEVVYGRGHAAVRALAGVSLEIEPGANIALLGRSGSGKTTLLHVLGGLVDPTAGTHEWHGKPLRSIDWAAERARGIAFVFQGANLLPYFTALENVAFAAGLAHEPGLGAGDLLQLVGLGDKAEHLPAELSGGEAQRVAIARALGQRPELLLCDEPTRHLDSDTAERVLELLEALHSELGFALVLATHAVDVAARLDRKVVLEDGRILAEER